MFTKLLFLANVEEPLLPFWKDRRVGAKSWALAKTVYLILIKSLDKYTLLVFAGWSFYQELDHQIFKTYKSVLL